MTKRNAVIAGSKVHAQAIMKWLDLSEDNWDAIAYGDELKTLYVDARLVRPLEGITERHFDWLMEVLIPRITRRVTPLPATWRPNMEDRPDAEQCVALC